MTWFAPILYLIINIVDAWSDRNINVNHRRGALLYATASAIVSIPLLITQNLSWLDVISLPILTRAAFFSPILNIMRGKSILYTSAKKSKGQGSVIDELERRLGISTFWLRIIYLTAYLAYIIFVYAR